MSASVGFATVRQLDLVARGSVACVVREAALVLVGASLLSVRVMRSSLGSVSTVSPASPLTARSHLRSQSHLHHSSTTRSHVSASSSARIPTRIWLRRQSRLCRSSHHPMSVRSRRCHIGTGLVYAYQYHYPRLVSHTQPCPRGVHKYFREAFTRCWLRRNKVSSTHQPANSVFLVTLPGASWSILRALVLAGDNSTSYLVEQS